MSLVAIRRSRRATAALAILLVVPAGGAAQSGEAVFTPACQLADDAAASAALGVEVTGDGAISNLYCSYLVDGVPVAMAALTPELSLDLARFAFPEATELTIAGAPALSSPGDEASSMPPTVLVGLDDGGVLMVNVMPESGVAEPSAAAIALAEALLASGPVTAMLPEEVSGPGIAYTGDPCDLLTLDELGGIAGATFSTAEPDGSGGCTYQSEMTDALVIASLTFSDGTLGPLRSSATTDVTVAERAALWWPDLSSLILDVGEGRLLSVMLLSMGPAEGGEGSLQEQVTAIAELAISRMTPTDG